MMMAMTFSDKRIALSWSTTGCYTSKSVETHWVLKNKISDCHGGDGDGDDGDGESSPGPFSSAVVTMIVLIVNIT